MIELIVTDGWTGGMAIATAASNTDERHLPDIAY